MPHNTSINNEFSAGVLNLFMVRANMKNGLQAEGHEYTYLRSLVKSLYFLFAHKRFAS